MIKYALICQNQHVFDAWFRDSAAFDEQSQSGDLTCPVCGDERVEKALMAPAILRKSAPKPARKPANETASSRAGAPAGEPVAKQTATMGEAGDKSEMGEAGKTGKTGDKGKAGDKGRQESKDNKGGKGGMSAEKLAEKSKTTQEIMQVMGKLHNYVVENFDYVGADFAEKARAMHYGEQESRAIYGESTPEEALALYEEGVPTAPLPIVPKEQKN